MSLMKDLTEKINGLGIKELDEVYVCEAHLEWVFQETNHAQLLKEGKWISGKFKNNIRIDQPTYGAGQVHAHVFGRKDNQIGVVNFNGTASHGTKFKLSEPDAQALLQKNFIVPKNRIIEFIIISVSAPQFLRG